MEPIIIDATNQKLGRLATQIADILRGKNTPAYAHHVMSDISVKVINASALDLSAKKLEETYQRYSGYPGGLTKETREHLIERRGYAPVVFHAVRGMLPRNRLRDRMLKNLTIEE